MAIAWPQSNRVIYLLLIMRINKEWNIWHWKNCQQAIEIVKYFEISIIQLRTAAGTKGFNEQPETPITHAIMLHLVIDGQQFLNQLFLMLDLEQHDVIIGWWWLAEKNIWMDICNQWLLWPNKQSLEDQIKLSTMRMISKEILQQPTSNPDHQADVKQWDKKMKMSNWRNRSCTEIKDCQSSMKKMQ